ncbi:uncharacterized protein ARMOST_20097 [Armillaria ostoyae]|uniref:Uncharacterized protein n=1 Tax=Armillaria ostoyae TaxID=47428 RepID=A0A284S6E6_ARMOS|nr:uncharacterized protein ARMOST_20097 [Armillaria ostoyae]
MDWAKPLSAKAAFADAHKELVSTWIKALIVMARDYDNRLGDGDPDAMMELLEDVDSEVEAGAHDEDSRANNEDDDADFSVGDSDDEEDHEEEEENDDDDEDDFKIYESDLKKVCQSGFSHAVMSLDFRGNGNTNSGMRLDN